MGGRRGTELSITRTLERRVRRDPKSRPLMSVTSLSRWEMGTTPCPVPNPALAAAEPTKGLWLVGRDAQGLVSPTSIAGQLSPGCEAALKAPQICSNSARN